MQIIASNFIDLYPTYTQMTNFMLVGFMVVLITLACLSLITGIVGLLFGAADKIKASAAAKAAAAASETTATSVAATTAPTLPKGGIDGAHLAVITAAVYAVLKGAKCRIVSIAPSINNANWIQSGRASIFASHMPKQK